MNAKPKQVDSTLIQTFSSAVPLGEYRMYSASTQFPSGIPWAGPTCQAVVVAASAYNSGNVPNALQSTVPDGPVFLLCAFRADPENTPHWNVDDALYFNDASGNSWRVHSKSAPDHFKEIVSGSALGDLIRDHDLPPASAGSIDEYRQRGANLDFEKPFNT